MQSTALGTAVMIPKEIQFNIMIVLSRFHLNTETRPGRMFCPPLFTDGVLPGTDHQSKQFDAQQGATN